MPWLGAEIDPHLLIQHELQQAPAGHDDLSHLQEHSQPNGIPCLDSLGNVIQGNLGHVVGCHNQGFCAGRLPSLPCGSWGSFCSCCSRRRGFLGCHGCRGVECRPSLLLPWVFSVALGFGPRAPNFPRPSHGLLRASGHFHQPARNRTPLVHLAWLSLDAALQLVATLPCAPGPGRPAHNTHTPSWRLPRLGMHQR